MIATLATSQNPYLTPTVTIDCCAKQYHPRHKRSIFYFFPFFGIVLKGGGYLASCE